MDKYRISRMLSGRYFRLADHDMPEEIEALAKDKGVTAPIIGATKQSHVENAADALGITLSETDSKRLEAPYKEKKNSWARMICYRELKSCLF